MHRHANAETRAAAASAAATRERKRSRGRRRRSEWRSFGYSPHKINAASSSSLTQGSRQAGRRGICKTAVTRGGRRAVGRSGEIKTTRSRDTPHYVCRRRQRITGRHSRFCIVDFNWEIPTCCGLICPAISARFLTAKTEPSRNHNTINQTTKKFGTKPLVQCHPVHTRTCTLASVHPW